MWIFQHFFVIAFLSVCACAFMVSGCGCVLACVSVFDYVRICIFVFEFCICVYVSVCVRVFLVACASQFFMLEYVCVFVYVFVSVCASVCACSSLKMTINNSENNTRSDYPVHDSQRSFQCQKDNVNSMCRNFFEFLTLPRFLNLFQFSECLKNNLGNISSLIYFPSTHFWGFVYLSFRMYKNLFLLKTVSNCDLKLQRSKSQTPSCQCFLEF